MTNRVGKKREPVKKKEEVVNPSRSTGDRTTTQVYFFFSTPKHTIFRRPPFVRQLLLSLPVAGGKTGGLYGVGGLQATLFTHPLFRAPALRLPTHPPPPCDYIGYCLSLPPCRCRPRVVRHRPVNPSRTRQLVVPSYNTCRTQEQFVNIVIPNSLIYQISVLLLFNCRPSRVYVFCFLYLYTNVSSKTL